MESKKDDSLKRWDQSEINDRIWQYFNTHVSKKIIFDAINNKLSLEDLYFQLALARTKCEMIKQYVKEHNTANLSDEKLALLHTHLIESLNDSNACDAGKFFTFHYEGGCEPLTTFESWGQRVEGFSRSRLNDPHNPEKRIIPGVSNFISFYNGWFWQTHLYHKTGFALDKADTDLQKMVQTTNLFEYFKISSHLVYALSNCPPTFRGSASISSWLMDYVGKNQFDFTQSIRPSLFDWAAFYESPEQYTSFFVISATVEYLKSLHVYPEIETFSEKMTFVLTKNPNENKEIQEREALWEELKSIIQIILTKVRLANPTLSEKQIKGLKELGSGHLEFRKISEQAIRISQLLATGMHVEEKNLDVLSPEDKEYFLQLNLLKWNAGNDLLASFGNDIAEQQANLLWADAEYLATKFLLPDVRTSPGWRNTHQDPKTPISKARAEIYAKYIQGGKSRLISSGCVDPQNVDNYLSIEQFIESKGLLPNVCRALRNGLKLKELNEIFLLNILTKEQLELLTENAALLLGGFKLQVQQC